MAGLILLRPIFSEKTQNLASSGVYTFVVSKSANKYQIKRAVETQFGVKVAKVRTANSKSEIKHQGRYFGKTRATKKAIVKLAEGSIDLWVPPEKETGKSEKSKKEKEKKEGK